MYSCNSILHLHIYTKKKEKENLKVREKIFRFFINIEAIVICYSFLAKVILRFFNDVVEKDLLIYDNS